MADRPEEQPPPQAAEVKDSFGTVVNAELSVQAPDNQIGVKNSTENEVNQQSDYSSPKRGPRRHRRSRGRFDIEEANKLRTIIQGLSEVLNDPKDFDDPNDFSILDRDFERLKQQLSEVPEISLTGRTMSSFMDNSPNPSPLGSMSRQSPVPSNSMGQVNGGGAIAGAMANGLPMNAGHQMDLNHLYEMVVELSDVLKHNREMTRGIITSAEEIMQRSATEGASPTLQQANGEISAARIAELERALAKERRIVEVLKREQVENTKLIGEYETAVGTMVEQIRNYCQNNNLHYLAQKRHYNNLLQAERDAHLESRLDRDHWHAQTMKCAEMIRTAYRLRCEEDDLPTRTISGLQNEVRAYRNALGMDAEKPEEEFGWEFLKTLPSSVD